MAEPLAADPRTLAQTHDFSALVVAEQRRVFLLCQRMLQDREEADSAAQDVFLKAFKAMQGQSLSSLDEPAKWLTRIAVNTCLDRLRSRRWQFWRKRPAQEDEETILGMTVSRAPDAEDQLFARQIQRRLIQALDRLSGRQRAVFTLKHFEDRSLEEIGEILGLDVGTVKAHMFRAVAKLRLELEDVYRIGRRA
ncbi:MAG: sigma-70 family RNA polymerase sigma factor [Acidobacteria bacterium]|nr:sigma-70 family RNA polymerase sigma factor [Acidobacteriota bacterium]